MAGYTFQEKKDAVLQSFLRAYDYELAISTFNVTPAERSAMESDELWWAQIVVAETRMKEKLITNLVAMAEDKREKGNVRIDAIKTLGTILYPERFKKDSGEKNEGTVVHVYLPENGRERKTKL